MNAYEKIEKLNEKDFKLITGNTGYLQRCGHGTWFQDVQRKPGGRFAGGYFGLGGQRVPRDKRVSAQCRNTFQIYIIIEWVFSSGTGLIFTDDINLNNIEKALIDFGAPPVNIEYLREKGNVVRFGNSPIKIDIINEASGINIEDCYSRKKMITVENIEIPLISKADLIMNKKSTGRQSDLGDVEKLESWHI